jgi:hypothetical protein
VAGNKAGDITYDIHGNTKPLENDLKNAQGKVASTTTTASAGGEATRQLKAATAETERLTAAEAELGAEAEKSVGSGGLLGSMRALRKEHLSQITLFSRMIGQITAVGTVAVTFYKIGEAISTFVIDRFATAKEKALEFREAVDTGDLVKGLKSYGDKLIELNERIYKLKTELSDGGNRRTQRNLKSELEAAEKERNEYTKTYQAISLGEQNRKRTFATLAKMRDDEAKATAQKAQDEKEQAAKNARAQEQKVKDEQQASEQVGKLQKKAAYDVMTEEQKIDADAEDARSELIAEHNKMNMDNRLANEQALSDALELINQKQYDAFKRIADERNRHIEEINKKLDEQGKKQEEAAGRVSKAWESSFRSIRDASNSVFNTDQAASMVQFAQQMQATAAVATDSMNRIVVEGVG